MADPDRIKDDIREIAASPKNVRLSDIERIVTQLGAAGFSTSARPVRHGHLYTVEGESFAVCAHRPGSSQVKVCYVKAFLGAMETLGLFGEEDDK